jgi:hypothetical protein
MTQEITKTKKRKKSILDDYIDEIRYYKKLGINTTAIARLVNEKTPVKLGMTAYRHFIETRV